MNKRKAGCYLSVLLIILLFRMSIFPLTTGRAVSETLSKDMGAVHNDAYLQSEFVPDEIIVKFKEEVSNQGINDILERHNASIKSINHLAGFMLVKNDDTGMSVRELIQRFRNHGAVEYAEPNYLLRICLSPDDPGYPQLWGLHNIGQTEGLSDADIDAPEAWDIQTGTSSVIVAVIDTGTDYNHEDLSANIWTNPREIPENGIDDDGNGFVDDIRGWDFINGDNDPLDDNSHGTHCSGIIAAEGNNGVGIAGVSWTARIMPLKFMNAAGLGTTTDAILAIQYAVQMGAKVMSNSWGGDGFSQALKDAIEFAHEAGVLFVATAGNNGVNNDVTPYYPASYDVPNIIAVAATDHNDELALSSNYGVNSVDLGAPGVDILSTVLNNGYGYRSGTSMAAPYVAGTAALLAAEYPGLTHEEIKAGILDSADKIPSLTGITASKGRLNAYGALIGTVPPPPPVPVTVFRDDMENGSNGWTTSDDSLWHQSDHRSVSPDTSWYYGIEGVYTYGTVERNSGSLTSPQIDLTDITSSELVFTHFLETENHFPYDTARVRITKDDGATFTDVFSKTATDGIFIEETLNISEFDGCVIRVQFFFDTLDAYFNNFEGWYIDDVVVQGASTGPLPSLPPVADAGPDQTLVDENGDGTEIVTLDGSGSYDTDGDILSFDWDFGDGTHGTGVSAVHVYPAEDSYLVTLTVTDNEGLTDTDTCMVTISEKESNIMHVGDISMSVTDTEKGNKNTFSFTYATATVTVLDALDEPVKGATVSGHWSGLTSDTDSGLTDTDGKVSLISDKRKNASGTFTFTVDDITLEDWEYDPSANAEESDSITG